MCIRDRMLTPSSSWSWLDMLLTLQAVTVAASTGALAVNFYISEAREDKQTSAAIISSFQVFFPLHSMLGAMILASILNYWSSNFRYALAFLWVGLMVLLHIGCAKYFYNISEDKAQSYSGSGMDTTDTEANPAGVSAAPLNMNKSRKDFPTM
eukprot:TRINITY_DN1934_c0_g1_i4.p1 TRINITY_DN1934_c0_g1~~TRINITY_DN1934_c0_g1_i4.p1  ORF type:complete len:153 (+),score=42.87 TRINITY_DN1934_c0_g1_i4:80-538(+)